jgi:hypothetical protein
MNKYLAVVLAVAAMHAVPALAEEEFNVKQCQKRCLEIIDVSKSKKAVYDYESVQNDPALTEAQKKKLHKDELKRACTRICVAD